MFLASFQQRPKQNILVFLFLLFLVFHILFVTHALQRESGMWRTEDHRRLQQPLPPFVHQRLNQTRGAATDWVHRTLLTRQERDRRVNPTLRHHLWPDDQTRYARMDIESASEQGLLHKNVMPYPSDVEDDPNVPERYRFAVEDFDVTIFITRADLRHSPMVFNIGLENFADLRLTVLTHTSVHVGLEERRALLAYQRNSSLINASNHSLENAMAFDYMLHEPYYSYEYNHERNISHRSPDTATALLNPTPPVSEVLTRLIQGDAVYDSMGYQLHDEHFPFERNMDYTFRNHFCDRFVELMHVPHRPPLVVHLHKMQTYQFMIRCLYLRPQALSTATRKFVLLATELDETAAKNFVQEIDIPLADYPAGNLDYLLNHPLLAHWYSTNGNIWHPKFTALPIGFQFYYRSDSILPMSEGILRELDGKHAKFTRYFSGRLNFTQLFSHLKPKKTKRMKWGSMTTMWLERALEVLVGSTVKPPVKIIPLDQLPERITTFYVVLMPIEKYKRADRPSLTDDVIIFEEPSEANHHRTASVQHIALLPFTVALYHKLRQEPHGSPDRDVKTVSSFTLWEWRYSWYYYLEAHKDISVPAGYGLIGYYRSLSSNAFVTSPSGKGYECFRTWESIALGAIPLLGDPIAYGGGLFPDEVRYQPEVHVAAAVEPYRDLPVIFLSELESITAANMTLWQKVIYEKASKGEYKLEKLFMQYWVDKIYGHTNED